MNYTIHFNFENTIELFHFIKEYEGYKAWLHKRKQKKENDKRGSMTVMLHQMAKKIKEDNPTKTYKECLGLAGKQMKENNS